LRREGEDRQKGTGERGKEGEAESKGGRGKRKILRREGKVDI